MADDLYSLLGVSKNASQKEIRDAYRKLAKKLHPDVNPGDREAEERFKKISAAYEILDNPEKRGRYDRGEIDASGQETHRTFYREYADAGDHPYRSRAGFEDFGDIFSDLFGARAGAGARGQRGGFDIKMRGADIRYTIEVDFLDAVKGATKRLTMPDGKRLDLAIPAGLRDGQILRLKGKGMPGIGGGPEGDALVEVHVGAHPFYRRNGDNIEIDLPVTLAEATAGGKIKVPTPWGPVSMSVPRHSNGGDTLRLKGKGIKRAGGKDGDLMVKLRVVLPDKPDAALEEFVRDWEQKHPYHPRKKMGG